MVDVYLIFHNRLFGDAVRAILATHPGIRLLGATDRPETASADVTAMGPGVILLEEVDDGGSPGPWTAGVQRILARRTPCRLITLRMDDDGMHVWSGTWRQTVRSGDLVEAIVTAGEEKQC